MKHKLRFMPIRFLFALSILLGYSNSEAYAHITFNEELEFAQVDRDLKGTITDSKGEPIIGASITVVGSARGTITDYDGNFAITVEKGQVLKISYIGYVEQQITVTNQKDLFIKLQEDTKLLDEVVVMGYGAETRKQDLSMAVSSVKIDESMKSRPSDLSSMIQGKLPGVTIQSSGGDPLNSATISIRGRGSRGKDGDPNSGDGVLFVVDGVPNAPYNVEDIETISVLKDAASAAMYGASVGSGGVILITTKQAQGGKTSVHFNMSQSISKVRNLPSVLTSEEYNKVWAKAVELTPNSNLPQVANPNVFGWGNVTRTDWLDEIFRTGLLQHYALSLSGGNDKSKSLFSVSYDKNKGTLINTYSEKLGAKFNMDYKINDWITFRENVSYQYTNGRGDINMSHEGPIIEAVLYPRSATVYEYDQEGNPVLSSSGEHIYGGTLPLWAQENISGYGVLRNPVATLNRLRKKSPTSKIFSTSTLQLNPIDGLTLKSDFTYGLVLGKFEEFESKVPEYGRPNSSNYKTIRNRNDRNWLWENTATYTFDLADKHNFNILAGYTMSYNKYNSNQTWVYGWDKEDPHSTIWGPNGKDPSKMPPMEYIYEDAMASLLGRIGYSYDDRYFATMSIRRDGSSRLPKDNRYDVFPAVSGSWKISSESFFQDFRPYINLLKVRGSWGKVGNVQSLNYYPPVTQYQGADYKVIFGQNLDNERYGYYPNRMTNNNLTWEISKQTGIGLDLGLFDCVELSVDYFHKKTQDLIDNIPVPYKIYPETTSGNVGEVVNKGWEVSLNYYKTFQNDLSVNLYANLSTVKCDVRDLGTRDLLSHDVVVNSMYPLKSAVGQPWYSFHLLRTDGIFKSQDEIDKYIYKNPVTGEAKPIQPNAKPGDLKFIDVNNDGEISLDDKDFLGSYLPKVTYAFGGNFSYKDFDFGFMFQGIGGNKIFNGFRQMGLQGKQGNNMLREVLDSYDFNPNSNFPRIGLVSDENGNYTHASDFFLESGSYLRLKNLTFGYTLPKSVMQSIGLPNGNIRFYLTGENIFTITPYSGIDPEVGNYGIDASTYPLSRSFSVGLNVNF